MTALKILAIIAGSSIAIQASLNSRLGVELGNSLLATAIAFLLSATFVSVAVIIINNYPVISTIKAVPIHLWFSGSILSALGVALFYFLIPKMGLGSMMSYALMGQLFLAVISSHYGWLGLPAKPIDTATVIGILAVLWGVFLINGR